MKVLAGWLRVALLDMRGGVGRFGILLACLALGVATIAIVGSVGTSLQTALARDARVVLGGDLEAQLSYRAALPEERALFERLGRVSAVTEVLGRGRIEGASAFLSLTAADAAYPLLGAVELLDAAPLPLPELLAERDGRFGVVAGSLLLDRLGLRPGSEIAIGAAHFEIRGVLGSLPDQVLEGIGIGIPALISEAGLAATGIIEPGVLARHSYRILLAETEFEAAAAAIRAAFPEAGWQIRSPREATDDLARLFDRFSRFLTVVGLSALLVGGVGVSSAVAAYIGDRQRAIATLRSLGATRRRILFHFLVQVLILTGLGVAAGLALGAAVTLIVLPVIGALLGIDLPVIVDPVALFTAAGFGFLTGFAFAWLPLRHALTLRPALLFRSRGAAVETALGWRAVIAPGVWLPLLAATAGIAALAILSTGQPLLVFWYGLGLLVAFLSLRLAAVALQHFLRRLPPLPQAGPRQALRSIYRPGSPAPTVILSLGLGLALLLLIASIDSNLRRQLEGAALADAPSFVFMDLFEDEVAALSAFSATDPRIAGFRAMPMLRGAITAIDGVPAAELAPAGEAGRLLEGEVPLTWSGPMPPQSELVTGSWWSEDHAGATLVSVIDELREPLGLTLGDTITFSIFGETLDATIANFRTSPWRDGGFSVAFLLSPGPIETFPMSHLGLLSSVPEAEREVQAALVEAFPELIFLPVGEALMALATVLDSVRNAVGVVAALSLVSGLFVLAGAMAAGRRQREADAVVMKVLGATRADILVSYLIEYALLGALAATLAVGLGLTGAWAVITQLMELRFTIDFSLVAIVLVATMGLTIAVGAATTWGALSLRPAAHLRAET